MNFAHFKIIMPKKLIGNQENVPEASKKYRYDKIGRKKAVLVHILGKGDCPRCWEKLQNHYTDGSEVWKRLPI